jgi:DNA-binding protein HU-beta
VNKQDLIDAIAKGVKGISRRQAADAVAAFTGTVTKALKKGDRVSIVGFGTFGVSKRAARVGRNPQTNAPMKIKAAKVPKFRPGKGLRDAIR